MEHNKIREAQFDVIISEMKVDYQSLMDELPKSLYMVTNRGLSREVQYIEYEIDSQKSKGSGEQYSSFIYGNSKRKIRWNR